MRRKTPKPAARALIQLPIAEIAFQSGTIKPNYRIAGTRETLPLAEDGLRLNLEEGMLPGGCQSPDQ